MTTPAAGSHESVLFDEVLAALIPDRAAPPRRLLDATFGRGGHSRGLLACMANDAQLYVMDRDPEALAVAQQLAQEDPRVVVLAGAFGAFNTLLQRQAGGSGSTAAIFDGILLDLGVSSPQFDSAERGFSLRLAGPLDMRMDPSSGPSAAEWLDQTDEQELVDVLRRYGDITYAPRLARAILAARPLRDTLQLAQIVAEATPAVVRRKSGRVHEATRCFQAIRIFINDELGQLDAFLPQAFDALVPGGRLAIISFHSLEDRKVKQYFRKLSSPPAVPRRLPIAAERMPRSAARTLGKAQRASTAEIERNPRARSATLRVLERVA